MFEDQQIGFRVAVELDAIAVVPLDDPFHPFSVVEDQHHGRPVLHLFQVVEAFGVGLLRRTGSLLLRSHGHLVFDVRQRRTDEPTIHRKSSSRLYLGCVRSHGNPIDPPPGFDLVKRTQVFRVPMRTWKPAITSGRTIVNSMAGQRRCRNTDPQGLTRWPVSVKIERSLARAPLRHKSQEVPRSPVFR